MKYRAIGFRHTQFQLTRYEIEEGYSFRCGDGKGEKWTTIFFVCVLVSRCPTAQVGKVGLRCTLVVCVRVVCVHFALF